MKHDSFELITKSCTKYYEITCGKVDRKTIATQSLIETAPGPDQRALYVLSNTATKSRSADNCKTLNMTLAMVRFWILFFTYYQNKPKTAAENLLITQALDSKSHYGYNYWLGMTYSVISNGWFWDDNTPVEGLSRFTNFLPGQNRSTSSSYSSKSCSTLLTNLTDSSGFGDLGKWRYEQCTQDGIHGLCSSEPGTDLALIYKCVDCRETGKPKIIVSFFENYDI